MGFTTFGLSDQIMRGIHAAGYTKPTPIQSLAIPPVLARKDVVGCAQTGTGKTAAFVLPLLHRLTEGEVSHARHRNPRVLVLTPTRELAQQVQDAVSAYGRYLPLRAISVYGGTGMESQLKHLRAGVDIVVATPGRLLDHLHRRTIDLSQIKVLVLDEADRMLDMGFINDVRKIIREIPAERQTLLFSATISSEISALVAGVLRDPQWVEVGERRNPVEGITQHFYSASREAKVHLLVHALEAEKMQSVLVFSRTKHGADKICRRLERKGINSVTLHSNRTQAQRQRALDGFKRGTFRVLVATDIAARGIDVSGISHVVNYDIPQYAEDYIHRIGRTGRAGARGDAITFVGPDEQQYLKGIERFTGKRFTVKEYPGLVPQEDLPAPEAARFARQRSGSPQRGGTVRQARAIREEPSDGRKQKSSVKKTVTSSTHGKSLAWSNH